MIIIKEDNLQTMCLNTIVCNIERYIQLKSDWDNSENAQKPTTIDFLRQWHSDYLHNSLRKKGKLITCNILNFLLSPHWKNVRIYSCHASHPSLFEKLKVIGTGITFLSLKNISVSPSILNAIFCCVPNVVYLNLSGTSCNNANLNLISKSCKKIRMLNLFECNVGTGGLMALMNPLSPTFESLQALNLEGTRVSEGCVPHILSYFNNLLHFNYQDFPFVLHNAITRSFLLSEESRLNLRSFDHKCPAPLPYPHQEVHLMNIIIKWAKCCPQVTRISIYDTISQNVLELLAYFRKLESLHLNNIDMYFSNGVSYINFTDSKFFKLRASQLTSLYINCAVISLKAILDECVNLKYLSFSSVSFKEEDIPAAYMNENKLRKLESFKLMHVDVESDVCKSLELILHFAKNLSTLGIRYSCQINRAVVTGILKMPHLKELDLTCSIIDSELLLLLFSSKTIKVIHTNTCPFLSEVYETDVAYVNNNQDGNTCGWKVSYDNSYDVNQDPENKSVFSWSDSHVIIDDISR